MQYLIRARARKDYKCVACNRDIQRGKMYFRQDPHPMARIARQKKSTHWCTECIDARDLGSMVFLDHLRVPLVRVIQHGVGQQMLPFFRPIRIELIGVGRALSERLRLEPTLVHKITPDEFEEFICDRLFAMGFEPRRIGPINSKDGGIDILFWSRLHGAFPFLGAAQIKHHKNPRSLTGSPTVREFAGAIASHPFNAGLLVTNTSFSPDAEWFAREHAKLIRLRGLTDIQRWLFENFSDDAEWREIPSSIELCPGLVVRIR